MRFLHIVVSLFLFSCSNEPNQEQIDTINAYIQEQLNVEYQEPDFSHAYKEGLLKDESIEDAKIRVKKMYQDIREYHLELKERPFNEQRDLIVPILKSQIELYEKTLAKHFELRPTEPPLTLINLLEQRRKWLKILKG